MSTYYKEEDFINASVGRILEPSEQGDFFGVAVKVVDFGSENIHACWATSGFEGLYTPKALLGISKEWFGVGILKNWK